MPSRGVLRQQAEALLACLQRLLGLLALADVADDAGEERFLFRFPGRERELDRELSSVPSPAGHLDGVAHDARLSGFEETFQSAPVLFVEPLRHDESDGLSYRFGGGVAEHSFGAAVPEDDLAAAVRAR